MVSKRREKNSLSRQWMRGRAANKSIISFGGFRFDFLYHYPTLLLLHHQVVIVYCWHGRFLQSLVQIDGHGTNQKNLCREATGDRSSWQNPQSTLRKLYRRMDWPQRVNWCIHRVYSPRKSLSDSHVRKEPHETSTNIDHPTSNLQMVSFADFCLFKSLRHDCGQKHPKKHR